MWSLPPIRSFVEFQLTFLFQKCFVWNAFGTPVQPPWSLAPDWGLQVARNTFLWYIRGEDNTVADALFRLPLNSYPDEIMMSALESSVNAVLQIATDASILAKIKAGYVDDEFCKHVAATKMKGWQQINGLWYIGDRLLIPHVTDIRENLFRLAHDTLGHFGADKSYASIIHIIGRTCVVIWNRPTSPPVLTAYETNPALRR